MVVAAARTPVEFTAPQAPESINGYSCFSPARRDLTFDQDLTLAAPLLAVTSISIFISGFIRVA